MLFWCSQIVGNPSLIGKVRFARDTLEICSQFGSECKRLLSPIMTLRDNGGI
jgi:hypothetical protein